MSNPTETITDKKGRAIQVRRMTAVEVSRFTRMCGPAADIDRWYGVAMLRAQVRQVGDVPVPTPNNVDQVDALAAHVDEDALAAVVEWASSIVPSAVLPEYEQAKN